MNIKEKRLLNYDNCVTMLRDLLEKGEGHDNDIRRASFLLGKIA